MSDPVASQRVFPAPVSFTRIELPADRRGLEAAAGDWLELDMALEPDIRVALIKLTGEDSNLLLAAGLAVLDVVLYKYTQQSDLWVEAWRRSGGQAADNGTAEPSGIRSTVVLCSLSDESRFIDVMNQAKEAIHTQIDQSAHEEVPKPNVLFGVADGGYPLTALRPDDLSIDLRLTLQVVGSGAGLKLSYRSALFHPERMRVLLEHYRFLLQRAIESPTRRVIELSLKSEAEHRICPDPARPIDQPRNPTIAELVMTWATQTPDAPAIHYAGRTWTYEQLATTSATITASLHQLGLRTGDVVAVTGERSFALVSAMLGIFRGGHVLLTLDPKLPPGRRKTMLEQARAAAVVFVGMAGAEGEIRSAAQQSVQVDAGTAEILYPTLSASTTESTMAALPMLHPEQAAYVFFTSGSTGNPKAVMGCHKGLSHFLCWQRKTFDIRPTDRAAQLTALSFDVILRDVFLALTSGASLCIPDEADIIDPARILPWLEREQVSVLHVVPSLARLWLNHVPEGLRLPHLRRLFFAGEPLMDSLVRRTYAVCGAGTEIINLYGPTETTLAKCFYRVPTEPGEGVQPIGYPLPETQILILNGQQALCGVGEIGEIAIRTPFRTLGYINAAEMNAKVFVQNPYRNDPDDLVYLTGDYGRYSWDGLLEILGRRDNQVKIRGVRIELGEIETAIGHHPDIREVVVVAREDAPMNKILVAYVVPRRTGEAGAVGGLLDDLREYSRARLPEIMVPNAFVVLQALPLNPNGKVDRKSLPAPNRASMVATQHAAPTEALEEALTTIWERVLKLDRIGIDDQFFDIGGHSLLAVQLVHAVSTSLGRTCTLPMLYGNRTIRSLAVAMHRGAAIDGKDWTVLALQPSGTGTPLFCVCGVHLYSELARELAPDIPVYGIFLTYEQELFKDEAERDGRTLSIEEIAASYLRAVRDIQPNGPYCIAGISFGGIVAYQMAQQLVSEGQQVGFLGLLDTMLPSVVRRNWARWLRANLRRARQEGFRELFNRVKRRIGTGATSATHPGAAVASRVDPEMQRLDGIRGRIFRDAELRYRPRPYRGSAVLARAEEKIRPDSDIEDPVTYGWGPLISRLATFDVTGDHLGILQAPHVAKLAQGLRPYLDDARQGPAARSKSASPLLI